VLFKAIIIHGNCTAGEVNIFAKFRIPNIAMVIDFSALADGGFFDLNEIADADAFGDIGFGS